MQYIFTHLDFCLHWKITYLVVYLESLGICRQGKSKRIMTHCLFPLMQITVLPMIGHWISILSWLGSWLGFIVGDCDCVWFSFMLFLQTSRTSFFFFSVSTCYFLPWDIFVFWVISELMASFWLFMMFTLPLVHFLYPWITGKNIRTIMGSEPAK